MSYYHSYFRKMVVTNACNNVRDILYYGNTDVISAIVKLVVHSPVGKLV